MPVYLRTFYFKKLVDAKKEEHDAHKKAQNKIKRPRKPSTRSPKIR